MKTLKGIGVSPGYAVGKAIIIKESEIDVNSSAFTSAEEELKNFQNAVSVYTKKTKELIESLTKEMKAAAKLLEFEHAAYLRDKIKKLRGEK